MSMQVPPVSGAYSNTSRTTGLPNDEHIPSAVSPPSGSAAFLNSVFDDLTLRTLASCKILTSLSFRNCKFLCMEELPYYTEDIDSSLPQSLEDIRNSLKDFHALLPQLHRIQLVATNFPLWYPGVPPLPNLQELSLDTRACTASVLNRWQYLSNCPNLGTLGLTSCTISSDLHFPPLPITRLKFENCKIVGTNYLDQFPNLQSLQIIRCTGLTPEDVAYLERLGLKFLDLTGSRHTQPPTGESKDPAKQDLSTSPATPPQGPSVDDVD
jgi:hypothetical protein